jgi:ketosteroid isomerase-like protein
MVWSVARPGDRPRDEWQLNVGGARRYDMKRVVIGMAFVVAAWSGLFAQDSGREAVVAAGNKFVDAYKACNVNDLGRMVTDDMQFMHIGGMLQDKKAFLAGVGTCALTDLQVNVMNVRIYGDAAIITGKQNYKTKTMSGSLFYTETWVKRNGGWLFASHQSTVPATPSPAAETGSK